MSLPRPEFDYVRRLVHTHAAIVIDPAKAYLVESRLAPLAKEHGCASLEEFLRLLQSRAFGALHREAVAAMANNETWFFRDSTPFTALAEQVIPRLLEARGRDQGLSIWCAACSTGQEPYSIAMLLRERYAPVAACCSILATDLCEAALQRAASGLYRQLEVNRGLPTALLTRYFTREGLYWQVRPEVAALVTFQRLNLAAPWPAIAPVDVLFLRNVLIYFAAETRRQVLTEVRRVLRPDGFLFLGPAETPRDLGDAFQPVEAGNYICYQPR